MEDKVEGVLNVMVDTVLAYKPAGARKGSKRKKPTKRNRNVTKGNSFVNPLKKPRG